MKQDKFEHFILKHTNDNGPLHCDLLDEMGTKVVGYIVEDEDQGPTKEWRPCSWYLQPSKEDIEMVSIGKSFMEVDILLV